MNAKRTPGPWQIAGLDMRSIEAEDGTLIAKVAQFGIRHPVTHANAQFIVTAANCHDDLVAALESAYTHLADNSNQWPERHTQYGQALLCRLRDAICKATGRDAQDVQDDYSNRYLARARQA